MLDDHDLIAALESKERVTSGTYFRWLREVKSLVARRYNGFSRPLNVKVEKEGVEYHTVYVVNTARLAVDTLPFTDEIPNSFVAKYVPQTFFAEREVEVSSLLSDSIGLLLYSKTSLEKTVELAFEKAEGSLSDCVGLDEISQDSTTDFAAIAYRIAEVLYALEEKKMVHGDIKPENMFIVRRDGQHQVRLGDFEWALPHAHYKTIMQAHDFIFGTPGFYPPEFFTPERYSIKNPVTHDMFSYGITLYNLLFNVFPGERKFNTLDLLRTKSSYVSYLIRGIYHQEMHAVLSDADIIPDLKDVILRAAHPRPQRRYQSFGDVLRKLEKYV